MGVLSRKERQMMEFHLRRYNHYRNRVDEYYAGIDTAKRPEVMASSNLPGNPTERQALAAAEPPEEIQDMQRWLQVHRMTQDRLDSEKREFLRRVWHDGESSDAVMTAMGIEIATFYRWRDLVTDTFAFCAAIKAMVNADEEIMIRFSVNPMI